MDKKIKLLVVPDDTSGVFKFREGDPHVYIQEHYGDEFDVDIVYMRDFPLNDLVNFFSKYDLIQVHKMFDKEMKIMKIIKFLNIPVIIDIDDNFKLGPDHPLFITAQNEGWSKQIVSHLMAADYVTTTTPIFAKMIKPYNKNVAVLPNAVNPDEQQFSTEKTKSDKIRFGLICGSTHMKDIELMQKLDILPQEIRDKMQFVLCGFDTNGTSTIYHKDTGQVETRPIRPEESVWCKYESFLTSDYKLIDPQHKDFLKKYIKGFDDPFENDFYRRFWTRDIQHYATHYQNVDVLLAPLKENDFNLAKSQLKFVECGFTNTAIIASGFGPYLIDAVPYLEKGNKVNENGNCLLVDKAKNHKDWAKYIKYLVENPEVIQKLKENLSRDMREKYSLDVVTKKRVELYKKIVEEKHKNG
jgi:glycosyltransferase involved in cell wall biosynthesis